jgi:hypothetical protein
MTSCPDDIICSCIEKLVRQPETGKILGYKIAEKLIKEGVKVCNTRHLEFLSLVKVRDEYKYFELLYDIYNSKDVLNLYDFVIYGKNPFIVIRTLIGLIRSVSVYTKVKVEPACIYPLCYQMLFRQDSSDSAIADRMYSYLSSLGQNNNDHLYSMAFFLESYYIACIKVQNQLNVIRGQIATCRKQKKISALQLGIGFIKDRYFAGGHMTSLIFETDPINSAKTICEYYDPAGLYSSNYINVRQIEKFLKGIFDDSVSYINMMEKLANPEGIQQSSYRSAIETKDNKFDTEICTMYCNYYIYKRFQNPGKMEETYSEMLNYYKEHAQEELFKWIIDIIKSCKTKTGNLWDDIRRLRSTESYGRLLGKYYAELSGYDEDEIAISSSIDIMKKAIIDASK